MAKRRKKPYAQIGHYSRPYKVCLTMSDTGKVKVRGSTRLERCVKAKGGSILKATRQCVSDGCASEIPLPSGSRRGGRTRKTRSKRRSTRTKRMKCSKTPGATYSKGMRCAWKPSLGSNKVAVVKPNCQWKFAKASPSRMRWCGKGTTWRPVRGKGAKR